LLTVKLIHSLNETCIKVYDVESKASNVPKRRIQVRGLSGAIDMVACDRYRCIYISDHVNYIVHRVDDEGAVTQWPVSDVPCGLSVNSVFNVLVTCQIGKVKEFTSYGELIREIKLNSSLVSSYPRWLRRCIVQSVHSGLVRSTSVELRLQERPAVRTTECDCEWPGHTSS
jgi:hypothetical protein